MGNYVSCTLSNPVVAGHNAAARVILPGGELRRLDGPTKAAEIMLEAPNTFVVNARSLQIGRRFSALSADEDLEMGNVYLTFPMKRVNSVITAADVGPAFLAATADKRRRRKSSSGGNGRGGVVKAGPTTGEARNGSRVQPEEAEEAPKLNLNDVAEYSSPEFAHRLSMSRSKKPLLETIVEEPVSLRS